MPFSIASTDVLTGTALTTVAGLFGSAHMNTLSSVFNELPSTWAETSAYVDASGEQKPIFYKYTDSEYQLAASTVKNNYAESAETCLAMFRDRLIADNVVRRAVMGALRVHEELSWESDFRSKMSLSDVFELQRVVDNIERFVRNPSNAELVKNVAKIVADVAKLQQPSTREESKTGEPQPAAEAELGDGDMVLDEPNPEPEMIPVTIETAPDLLGTAADLEVVTEPPHLTAAIHMPRFGDHDVTHERFISWRGILATQGWYMSLTTDQKVRVLMKLLDCAYPPGNVRLTHAIIAELRAAVPDSN